KGLFAPDRIPFCVSRWMASWRLDQKQATVRSPSRSFLLGRPKWDDRASFLRDARVLKSRQEPTGAPNRPNRTENQPGSIPWNLSKPHALSVLHGRRCEMSLDIGKVAIALLGLLAYKNRDKIGELIAGRNSTDPKSAGSPGGLGDILDRLRNAGAGDQVDSWVGKGSNRPVQPDQVEKAIDPQTLSDLAEQTGLSRDELLDRLIRELPDAVDKLTPDGQMPVSNGPDLLDEVPGPSRSRT
ncbi:YidB family protein, partial [Mesorhizobium sp. M1393]|uniref:YidB family protein n=2 Tax=unclassified Mesorhizobium TaxID=325217 RepID=UPI00333D0B7B